VGKGDIKFKVDSDTREARRDMDKFQKELDETAKKSDKLRAVAGKAALGIAAVATASIAATAAIFSLVTGVTKEADEIAKLSKQIGVSTEELSQLRFITVLNGGTTANLTTALKQLSRAMQESREGTGEMGKVLDDLGIKMQKTDGTFKTVDEVLVDFAEALEGVADQSSKVAFASDVMGRAGFTLLPVLKELAINAEKYRKIAQDLGIVLDQETAAASENLNDQLFILSESFRGIKLQIARDLIPVFASTVVGIREWVTENKELLRQDIPAFLENIVDFGIGAIKVVVEIAGAVRQTVKAFKDLGDELDQLTSDPLTWFNNLSTDISHLTEETDLVKGQTGLFFDELERTNQLTADEDIRQIATAFGVLNSNVQATTLSLQNLQQEKTSLEKFFQDVAFEAGIFIEAIRLTLIGFGDESAFVSAKSVLQLEIEKGQVKQVEAEKASERAEVLQEETDKTAKSVNALAGTFSFLTGEMELSGGVVEKSSFRMSLFGDTQLEALTGTGAFAKGVGETTKAVKELNPAVDEGATTLEDLAKAEEEAKKKAEDLAKSFQDLEDSLLLDSLEGFDKEVLQAVLSYQDLIEKLAEFEEAGLDTTNAVRLAQEKLNREISEGGIQALEDVAEKQKEVAEAAEKLRLEARSGFQIALDDFIDANENNAQVMADFWGETMRQMVDDMSSVLVAGMKGEFDSIVDFGKAAANSLRDSFFKLFADIASRQIVLNIVGSASGILGGVGGAGGGGGGGGGSIINQLGGGGGLLGGVGGALGNFGAGLTTSPFGLGGILGESVLPGINTLTGGTATNVAGSLAGTLGQFALLGAPVIGIALGALFGGMEGAIQGGFAGAGALIGSVIPGVGTLIGGIIGSIIGSIVSKFFSKTNTSRLGFAAEFSAQEIIDEELGTANATGLPGIVSEDLPNELERTFLDLIKGTLIGLQGIFSEISIDALDLLNTSEIQFKKNIKSNDKKVIEQKLKDFLEGGFLIPLLEDTQEAFVAVVSDLGFDGGVAQTIIDDFQQELEDVRKAAPKGEKGQAVQVAFDEFLLSIQVIDNIMEKLPEEFQGTADLIIATSESLEAAAQKFATLTTALQIIRPELFDPVDAIISELQALGTSLGFDGIPSITEFRLELERMINEADLPPDVINKFAQLKNAVVSLVSSLATSIGSLSSSLAQVSGILGTGGTGSGALTQGIEGLQGLIETGLLSPTETEGVLQQMLGLTNQLVSQQQQAVANQEARLNEARKSNIGSLITAEELRLDLILEGIDAEREIIEQQLQFALAMQNLAANVIGDIRGLTVSSASPLTGFEKISFIQGEIGSVRGRLSGATDAERVGILDELRQLEKELVAIADESLATSSPEFIAIFTNVLNELTDIKNEALEEGDKSETLQRTLDQLNATAEASRIEIQARIEQLRASLSQIGVNQLNVASAASAQARGFYSFIQEQLTGLLDLRLSQLVEIEGFLVETELEGWNTAIPLFQEMVNLLAGGSASIPSLVTGGSQSGSIQQQQTFLQQTFQEQNAAALSDPTSVEFQNLIDAGFGSFFPNLFAHGGTIREPVVGFGTRTGQTYVIGEKGDERITPVGQEQSSGGETILRIIIEGDGSNSELERILQGVIDEYFSRGKGRRLLNS